MKFVRKIWKFCPTLLMVKICLFMIFIFINTPHQKLFQEFVSSRNLLCMVVDYIFDKINFNDIILFSK